MKVKITPKDVTRYVVAGLARDMKKNISCIDVCPDICYSIACGVEYNGYQATIKTIQHSKDTDPVAV